jgi:lipoprotein-anchoring transpeptidase ErfK/SrfK
MAVAPRTQVPASRRPSSHGRVSRPILALAASVVLVMVAGAGVYLYDRGRHDVIANGVRVGGVDLGGLKVVTARQRLRSRLAASLHQPVTVTYHSRHFTLTGREAHRSLDINALVHEALQRSRSGSIVSRTLRGLLGGRVNIDLPLAYRFDGKAVRTFAVRVRRALDHPARNASARPDASGTLAQVSSRDGVLVNSRLLRVRVEHALTHPNAARPVPVPAQVVAPAVTTSQLATHYPAYIVVDRGTFTLRLYRHLKLSHSYPIAVGMQGLDTPAGLWHIQWMQVNPPWYVPHDAWTGSLAGKVIPPGPADPLKARFMSFDGGAGIHGIDPSEYGTIGHTASHGCIRMTIPDVIDLYSKVDVGTPVYIL